MRIPPISPPSSTVASTRHGPHGPITDLVVSVITPMFGGAARPGTTDPDWPVSGKAVRGHLRFWWRACNARRFGTPAELYEEESRIWGAPVRKASPDQGPSPIIAQVITTKSGTDSFHYHDAKAIPFHRRGWHKGELPDPRGMLPRGPALALFPFTDCNGSGTPCTGKEDVRFRLRITLAPSIADSDLAEACEQAVGQALWAWVTFGGVGARTRRGCGALRVLAEASDGPVAITASTLQPPSGPDALSEWFSEGMKTNVRAGNGLGPIPSLSGVRLLAGSAESSSIDAWRLAVERLQEFRQGRDVGRNYGDATPGQSRWPEPAAVRGLLHLPRTGQDQEHHEYKLEENADGRDFPRADLGLPILFQNMRGRNDPQPTLEGKTPGMQRMASPLILKPLALANGTYLPIALMLDAPHPWHPDAPPIHLKNDIKPLELTLSPMNNPAPHWPFPDNPPPVAKASSAREAFMDWLAQDRGWRKVR